MDKGSTTKEHTNQSILVAWIELRQKVSKLLETFFSEEALKEARAKNWSTIAIIAILSILLGAISDLMTIFGNIVEVGLILSLILFIILSIRAYAKKELRKNYVYPLLILLISIIIFSFVFISQKLFAAGDRGVLVELNPKIKDLQRGGSG